VTLRQAEALCEAVAGLPDEDAVEVEAACVPFATGHDYTAFMRKVRREVLALGFPHRGGAVPGRDRRPPRLVQRERRRRDRHLRRGAPG
jgi:hypothetical protein